MHILPVSAPLLTFISKPSVAFVHTLTSKHQNPLQHPSLVQGLITPTAPSMECRRETFNACSVFRIPWHMSSHQTSLQTPNPFSLPFTGFLYNSAFPSR